MKFIEDDEIEIRFWLDKIIEGKIIEVIKLIIL